jgi:hypothetical protein
MEKICLMDLLKKSLAAGNEDGMTDRQRRKRERTARALAIAFNGDQIEWPRYLAKADAFNRALVSLHNHSRG